MHVNLGETGNIMGGLGSGRVGTKAIVENCLVLSADALARQGLLGPDQFVWDNVQVRTGAGEPGAYIVAQVDTRNPGHYSMHLRYPVPGGRELFDGTVPITTTTTPWGALRWWFACPVSVGEGSCGRRAGKLYLPPGERYFGCRHCYGLTYTSCNESHKFDGILNYLAASIGPGVTGRDVWTLLKPYR